MRNLCGELVLKDVHRSLRMPLLLGNWFLAWNLFAVTMVSGQDMLNELDSPTVLIMSRMAQSFETKVDMKYSGGCPMLTNHLSK
ncbi:hypothetical protein M8J76_016474 [Diaphorina citri]|nr:hypothetical protein M8J76_016474 [Diaphorina citri]